jgi:putative ABC transport system ATP-binding protein
MAIIDLKHIAKEYRSDTIVTPALTDIDLSIDTGEFVAIMGASGSGKTTLLNIIGCMDIPTTGTYLFDGMDLSLSRERQLSSIRGKRIAFVFQHFALIDDYTVFENVEVPLIKQNYAKAERKKKVLAALKAVGISELARKRPVHISGGQKQRVAIARAMACGADIILADEPTGALDSKTGKEIMRLFSDLNNAGKTIILITHDRQIASYAKRLITIQDGRILKDEQI